EVVVDPGQYKGDKAKFNEWWMKMQIWINANWDGMKINMEVCCAVETWPEWKDLKPEIKGFFRPQTEMDWAR
ncbi:hypothetical protein BS17DRAFT_671106, partial [Gyrodon lividus]